MGCFKGWQFFESVHEDWEIVCKMFPREKKSIACDVVTVWDVMHGHWIAMYSTEEESTEEESIRMIDLDMKEWPRRWSPRTWRWVAYLRFRSRKKRNYTRWSWRESVSVHHVANVWNAMLGHWCAMQVTEKDNIRKMDPRIYYRYGLGALEQDDMMTAWRKHPLPHTARNTITARNLQLFSSRYTSSWQLKRCASDTSFPRHVVSWCCVCKCLNSAAKYFAAFAFCSRTILNVHISQKNNFLCLNSAAESFSVFNFRRRRIRSWDFAAAQFSTIHLVTLTSKFIRMIRTLFQGRSIWFSALCLPVWSGLCLPLHVAKTNLTVSEKCCKDSPQGL